MNKKGVKLVAVSTAMFALVGSIVCGTSGVKANASQMDAKIVKTAENNSLENETVELKTEIANNIEENQEISIKVEEMKKQLLDAGYTEEELNFIHVCEEIEEINEKADNQQLAQDEKAQEKVVEQIDNNVEEFYEEQQNELEGATGANQVTQLISRAYQIWQALTPDEKKLVVLHPAKALAVNATSSRATEITIMTFGINGWGDKSDGFRHGLWNALMARDIGHKYAEKFANAHESGKTETDLEQMMQDGNTEKEHTEMDLHNNSIGRSVVGEDEEKTALTDNILARRIYAKLTNNPSTGIYWLN